MRPVLQYRWRIELLMDRPAAVYYGLRNYPGNQRQVLTVSAPLAKILAALDGKRPLAELALAPELAPELRTLIAEGVVVDAAARRMASTRDRHRTCVACINNDYVIPGLEFDAAGVCAFCQCYRQADPARRSTLHTVTEEELLATVHARPGVRFDVLVFYTGGKDSSFQLWYLAKRLKLRVLAAFWDMPYTHQTARDNIRRARACLPEVEFIEWTIAWDTVRTAMRDQLRQFGWPCLCPSAAFPLFYPLAFRERIPFVLFGMEDAQAAVMDYVFARPAPAGQLPPPRAQTLDFLKVRALPRPLRPPVTWEADLANYHASVRNVLAPVYNDLVDIVRRAETDPALPIPLVKRLCTDKNYGTWSEVFQVLQRELDWRMPPQESMLHTSCRIEAVKDYCQFRRFQAMRTVFFPQSLVEISAAVHFGLLTRAEALRQSRELGYLAPPPVLAELQRDLQISEEDIRTSRDELACVLGDS